MGDRVVQALLRCPMELVRHEITCEIAARRVHPAICPRMGVHPLNRKQKRDCTPLARVRERPRLLTELPPDLAALVEDVTIDSRGRAIPKLYNKLQASKELRAMLDIGRPSDKTDVSRLSDAELVAQLADKRSNWALRLI
jgi:hypothetical protein